MWTCMTASSLLLTHKKVKLLQAVNNWESMCVSLKEGSVFIQVCWLHLPPLKNPMMEGERMFTILISMYPLPYVMWLDETLAYWRNKKIALQETKYWEWSTSVISISHIEDTSNFAQVQTIRTSGWYKYLIFYWCMIHWINWVWIIDWWRIHSYPVSIARVADTRPLHRHPVPWLLNILRSHPELNISICKEQHARV